MGKKSLGTIMFWRHSAPSNIVHFVCGYEMSLFLDSDENVFSAGNNLFYKLGLGHITNELKSYHTYRPLKKCHV